MFVLYNNMLQSLFGSQILTLGLTALLLTGMFLVLFRSVKIALIAISANLLPIGAVLGYYGLAAYSSGHDDHYDCGHQPGHCRR
jgi:predicted RND superfamily exporter protein